MILLAMVVTLVVVPARPAAAAPPTISRFQASVDQLNRVRLTWDVTGGDSSGLLYVHEQGFANQNCRPVGQTPGCQMDIRVSAGGVHRYVLSVAGPNGERATRTAEVTVPAVAPPSSSDYVREIDMYDIRDQTLTWTRPAGTGWVTINDAGTHTGTSTTLPASAFVPGENRFRLRHCQRYATGLTAICSAETSVTYVVGPSPFLPMASGGGRTSEARLFRPEKQALHLEWSGISGTVWALSAPTLGVPLRFTSLTSYDIPAESVVAGVHEVTLTTCASMSGPCSNRVDRTATVAGTVRHLVPDGTGVLPGTVVASVTPSGGGSPVTITATRLGTYYGVAGEGATVASGAVVGAVVTTDNAYLQVVVGNSGGGGTWTSRSWEQDFTADAPWETGDRPGTGSPLDVAIDSSGDVWQLGEFATSISQVDRSPAPARVTHHVSPLGRIWNGSSRYEFVRPYQSPFAATTTTASSLGERIIDTGTEIWYTQGGDLAPRAAQQSGNRSRIVRFDRNGTDLASTPDDDRLCGIHVPDDDLDDNVDDNEVIGIAKSGNRVWFSEARPGRGGALSWFVEDGSLGCDNDLDYGSPAAVRTADVANHCTSGTQTGCIHQIRLPTWTGPDGWPHQVAPANLAVDGNGTVWFADYTGRVLGRYVPATEQVTYFPMPDPKGHSLFRGYPWQIRVDDQAVYIGEYGDNELVRFAKPAAGAEGPCRALVQGANPCMSELLVPVATSQVNVHSIELHGGRLWFTATNEAFGTRNAQASYLGYVDLQSWATGAPTGVVYDGLQSLGTPLPGNHHSFRGIDVATESNRTVVALADMHYRETIRLTSR